MCFDLNIPNESRSPSFFRVSQLFDIFMPLNFHQFLARPLPKSLCLNEEQLIKNESKQSTIKLGEMKGEEGQRDRVSWQWILKSNNGNKHIKSYHIL